MSEASSPAVDATKSVSVKIGGFPLPPEAMKRPRYLVDGLVLQQVRSDCLALSPTPRAHFHMLCRVVLGGSFLVATGLVLLALGFLLAMLLMCDSACAGRSSEQWLIDGLLATFFLCVVLMQAEAFFLRREQRFRRDRVQMVMFGIVMLGLCLAVFAWRWDQSSLAMRLLGLPLYSLIMLLDLLGGCVLLFVPVAFLSEFVWPSHIRFNRPRWITAHDGILDFPKPLCEAGKVAAIQVVGGAGSASGPDRPCQVNLAVNDPDRPRVGLAEYSAPAQAREVAQTLADFLGVPLVVSG